MVASDSNVARGWVDKQCAKRADALPLLGQLFELLGDRRIAVPYVSSTSNVADEPSHWNDPRRAQTIGAATSINRDQLQATLTVLNDAARLAMVRGVEDGRRAVDTNVRRPV